jgi:hypothetical protein
MEKKNTTLDAFFNGCGAFIAFTGAAFIPGGMLACLAIRGEFHLNLILSDIF